MKTFHDYLKRRDPELYDEMLFPLAVGLAAAGAIAPRTTGRALKYVAKKGVDVAAGAAGHLINKGIDLGADALKGGVKLAGKGIYHGSMAAGRGVSKGVRKALEKPDTSDSQQRASAPQSQNQVVGGTWYA